jgi:hypothetical protein
MSAASAARASAEGPQVIIGVTALANQPEPETMIEESSSAAPQAAAKLEVVAEPSLELVKEPERLELVAEKTIELVTEDEPRELRRHDETPPPVEAAAPLEADAPPSSIEKDPFDARSTDPDEVSIPPIGDAHAEKFFSDGDLAAHAAAHAEDESWDALEKAKRKLEPEVVERRTRFARYVRWAVAGAAIVCLAAAVRTALAPKAAAIASRAPSNAAAAAVHAPPPEPKAAVPVVAIPSEPPQATKAEEAPKADAPAAAKGDEPTAETTPAAPAESDKTAAEEKVASRRALERGKLDEAIAAGERSVALDPTDGEAWLLLGASYQEKGNGAEARRAYKACTEQGKRGPVGECRAMLRF